MNSEIGSSPLVLVEDNEEIRNASVLEESGKHGESIVHNNGSYEVQNNDCNEKGTEASESVSSFVAEMKSEVSPSPTMTRKGYGLKKWRRIKRDVSKVGESSEDAGKMVMQELSDSVVHPSKRTQVYAERQQKSEGSVSSANHVAGSLDVFTQFGDPSLVMGPSIDPGTDSENNEGRGSKSSTAVIVPRIKYEMPAVVGFPHDKIRMRSLTGKNLAHSVQRDQQGMGRIEAIKKARGELVRTVKENSDSSIESVSRSSNIVFMQSPYATSNGIRTERLVHSAVENGNNVQRIERQVSDWLPGGYGRESEGGYEDISPEDVVADSLWEVQKEKTENHGSSSDEDPLAESIFALQTAQEALEKEVLKFKEIGKESSADDLVSDVQLEVTDVGQKFQKISSEQFPSVEGVQNFSGAVQSEMVEIANREAERELEDLFRRRIEAEVEYLAMSGTFQKLRVAVAQVTCSEEHETAASKQALILYKHEDKAMMLKKEVDKLENCCKDIASSDEASKLQKRVCKHASYFLVQLLSLLVILVVFVFQLSPNYVKVVVPT